VRIAGSHCLAAHAAFDAPTECSAIDCQVGTNGHGINEADGLGLTTFDDGEPRKHPFVVFVLVLIEPQPAAETDWRRKFWC
jgi:hypothetical protein